jgi:hypothetical protein
MATAEQIASVLPGKAVICRSCDNITGSFGCKVDVQSGFYRGAESDQKQFFGNGMEQKLALAPEECPIRILLAAKEAKI